MRQEILRGARALPCSTTWKVFERECAFSNVTQVLILRCYYILGLVLAEMDVGSKFLENFQTEIESTYKYSGAQLGGLFSRHAKYL